MIGSKLIELGCSRFVSDITDAVEVDKELKNKKPEVLINLAAMTDVDWCQEHPHEAMNVNTAVLLFDMAEKHNTSVVQLSSCHLFSGRFLGNYKETMWDVRPVNSYGFTKLISEANSEAYDNVKIVRASAIISPDRKSFAHYMDNIGRGETVRPPAFMWRSFIHLDHFVEQLVYYADRFDTMPKRLNLAGSKVISWYNLIRRAASYNGNQHLVKPRFFDSKLPGQAPRPHRTGLNTNLSKSLGFPQYDYLDCLSEIYG